MQVSVKTILVGAAAMLAAGAITPARAGDSTTHILTIALPDGAVEHIRYRGDVPPTVVMAPAPFTVAAPFFGPDPAFAALQRMSAALDAQAAVMLQQAAELPRMTEAQFRTLPAGATGYSFVSTFSSNGACTRTTQVTYRGDGLAPQTVSNVSGDCGGQPATRPVPARIREPAPAPRTILADAAPEGAVVREADWRN
jgi:hypothetical protein